MPKVRVADISIHYETYGQGEPLVLIMGLGGGSSMWWRQVAFFSPEYRVVVYDSRGVGRTDKPDMPYSMDMLVGDAAGLLERLGIASAHIYGVSMGGMVASQETLQKLFGIMTLSPEEAVKVATSVTFSPTFIERHPDKINDWLIKGAESPPSPMGFKRQAEAVAGFDTYDRLQQIRVPTLILAGTADQLIPSDNSRILASRIPDAKLVLLEGAGHGYLWEAEEEANRTVHDFLRKHSTHPRTEEKGG
jgi:pimeloyl-ACP methyl ester carboxylesterase